MLALHPLRAAELVTLRSGFTFLCTSRVEVSAGTVRLLLAAGDRDHANYIDLPMSAIASVEAAPEPVQAVPLLPVSASPAASSTSLPAILQRSGAAHNVSVALLAAVIRAESAGHVHAVSRTGAQGLMQLMPGTAAQLGVEDSFEPASNVNGGTTYLGRLLTRYHEDVALALAAYNAGPAAVDRYHGIPPYRETRLYVARVVREFNLLTRLQAASVVTGVAGPAASSAVRGE